MSVMDEMKNVVTVGRELLSTVSGKMKQIDDKVDAATASVPTAIRNLSEQVIYVDAVAGSDNNDGSASNPVLTARRAINMHIAGTSLRVLLKEGQDHITTDIGPLITSGYIYFSRWGSTGGVGRPILYNTAVFYEGNSQNRGRLLSVGLGSIVFEDVDIVVENPENGQPLNTLDGFIYTHRSSVTAFFINSNISLRNRPLFGSSLSARTSIDLHFYGVEINIDRDENGYSKLILGTDAVYTLGVSSVSLPSGKNWKDMVPVNADFANIKTNMALNTLGV